MNKYFYSLSGNVSLILCNIFKNRMKKTHKQILNYVIVKLKQNYLPLIKQGRSPLKYGYNRTNNVFE